MIEFPRQGSIYWFNPEPSKGAELRKIRPGVIVSPDEMNSNIKTVIIVPLTSAVRPWDFRLKILVAGHSSSLACDQIRSIDKTRLKYQMGSLKKSDLEKLFVLLQSIFS
ncbi:MAG TPA: type II toxin-antitoxin system PemK/MazF family toxin [Candidatus Saccharimonadales bacterium]|nr:type II toxin-antitoxin system PemK/MazF family toxin [Candidatus Saccharimonadales bacterium]